MKKHKIVYEPAVEFELHSFYEFIAQDNYQAAKNWLSDIREAIESLSMSPQRCPLAIENAFHDFEIRHLIFGNYRIVFRIVAETVQILHIRHSKMKPKEI